MEALDYLKKIENNGFEAYIVGGYVRDYLLGEKTTDVDITTNGTPKDIAKIFDISSKDNLGCINIKSSDLNVDITTYRKEKDYENRHPKSIEYVDDLYTDLQRRDFTVNTICMDSNGEIIDLLGGRKDLENRLIKVVGDTKEKFTNDPLRMLRAIRLSVIYDFKINEEELIFILNNKHLFKEISYERRKEEIGKILVNKNAIKGLNLLKSLNLLDVLEINFPEDIRYAPDYIGMWAQLTFSSKYPFTKVEHTRMNTIRQILKEGVINKVTLFKYGKYDPLVAAYILGINKLDVMKMYDEMPIHSKEELAISGSAIKSLLGLESSPKIKYIKIDLIKKVLNGDLENDTEILEKYILENWK